MTVPSFGDNVRIRDIQLTQDLGLAGLRGVVYGSTTPSVTGVTVIGGPDKDYAVNVHFAERNEDLWFAPDLVEVLDHGAGTEITIDGVDKKWVRRADGEWDEHLTIAPAKRRWWKFWNKRPPLN
jgi:hypothetical protein